MTYLLDTNTCIAVINGREASIRRRFEREEASGRRLLATSVVAAFELWYGVAKSAYRTEAIAAYENFLRRLARVVDFDPLDAEQAAEVRAGVEAVGTPIGVYDTLIAGQALNRGYTLVTANTREFERVPGLEWEDWAAE